MSHKIQWKQLFLYGIVGCTGTLAEWLFFFLFKTFTGLHYTANTVISYLLATLVNWGLGRLLVFHARLKSLWRELTDVYLAALVGSALNVGFMLLLVGAFRFPQMISKMLASCVVFFYNYLVRKYFIYRNKPE